MLRYLKHLQRPQQHDKVVQLELNPRELFVKYPHETNLHQADRVSLRWIKTAWSRLVRGAR
jgi:hypothetical protein